jgi:hypothetical protein
MGKLLKTVKKVIFSYIGRYSLPKIQITNFILFRDKTRESDASFGTYAISVVLGVPEI